MKKDLIEWGVLIALYAPITAVNWDLANRYIPVYIFMQVIFLPLTIILTKVIMRVMGWDK